MLRFYLRGSRVQEELPAHASREIAAMYQTLLLDISGNLATITLNRPEKRNAISTQMMAELQTALDEIERSHARVGILTGAGKAFCAGMDLDMLACIAKQSPAENQEDSRQIGEKRSRDLLLTGRILEAAEAKEFGLVSEVVPADKLMERAHELANLLIAASPSSLTRSKHLLVSSAAAGVDHDLERAILENARIRCTPDFQEGLASFLEKRKPVWQGDSEK